MFWQFPNNVELCLLKFEGEGEEEEDEGLEEEVPGPEGVELPGEFPFNCPKCGTDIIISTSSGDYPIKVLCSKCGAKGSLKTVPTELLKRWLEHEDIEYDEETLE